MDMAGQIKKLLIIRQDKLGDLVTTTPALRAVKLARPDLHVTAWIPRALEPVLRHNPNVDAVGFTTYRPDFKLCAQHVREIRDQRFDAVVFVKSRAGTHIPLTWFARIPQRVGSTRKSYGRFLTRNLALDWDEMHEHEAELSYRVLEACLGQSLERLPMEVMAGKVDEEQAAELVGSVEGYFCVHPGTGGTCRPWPEERYAQAIRDIYRGTGLTCLVTGTLEEAELAQRLAEGAGEMAVSVAGKTSILSLAALLRGAKMVLVGSTGTLHLAASQQTPCLLIEPTPDSAQRIAKWAPWMSPHRAVGAQDVCAGCNHIHCHQTGKHCVESIEPSMVVEAALSMLKGGVQSNV